MIGLVHIAGAVLRIDLGAIVANYHIIRKQAAGAEVAGVVKANAYGLGAPEVAAALAQAGCRHFFVAQLSEAVSLRHALDASGALSNATLYVLNGLQPGAESVAAEIGVTPVLNSLDQVDRWSAEAAACGRALPAALQVDSGMSRLGLPPAEVETLASAPERLNGIDLRVIMSHLACADDATAKANKAQTEAFEVLASRFPGVPRSLDNSGGSFLPRGHFNIVRPGIALYGGAPQAGSPNPMHPVVTLEARIVQVRDVPAGVGVGYGLSSVAGYARRIATIAVGYADGWPRHLSNCGSVFIGGHRAPIAGRVSMDSITIDVTEVPPALLYPGASVELLGPHQTIDDVASDAGTISYEILTQLGQRYAREYIPVAEG
ncbi:alanine racemase [Pseudochelatococcus contaminans]|uniref:Alanine racemase n=1 Tax=Pseudochelatococcus contaminans TaxID=1538103 RepID=A0A7W6EGW0_9HYPH|nr:alanine racemase [Pseudochelatococcus contaminans]MBB3809688.1 alanine racemase [Pseudochelatococcus contaminans]